MIKRFIKTERGYKSYTRGPRADASSAVAGYRGSSDGSALWTACGPSVARCVPSGLLCREPWVGLLGGGVGGAEGVMRRTVITGLVPAALLGTRALHPYARACPGAGPYALTIIRIKPPGLNRLYCGAAQARSQAGSNIGVEYSLPPERDDGYRRGPSKVYATVPQGTVATTVAPDWLANELAGRGKIDAACRDRMVMHLMTAAGASAPADAVFRFTAGEAMQTEDDDEDADRSEEYSDDDGRASDL
ncbi:hypothetical protein EMIHUDRAFT_255870 [Emiliania huxleyi CCMP1516]|uniref:Uncharacterized protein n=2 Tax=Emiliania huxleyi TaxID=2903 RepID=A0A0D3J2E1_EMIH1|nr:hypothetical protein EMIHUDRAFT_255870 [Emiliania huxleyi CCMP1516]EOD17676.1 hypothetical protein EMIHUDRAFT_255870 [Emiliania huxleyi CCMP1516]|eukprot:XP_005770105.1 hypothetical protein EMIHUDRAFT_255870 [Emiliania huxleyi CCMP1516]